MTPTIERWNARCRLARAGGPFLEWFEGSPNRAWTPFWVVISHFATTPYSLSVVLMSAGLVSTTPTSWGSPAGVKDIFFKAPMWFIPCLPLTCCSFEQRAVGSLQLGGLRILVVFFLLSFSACCSRQVVKAS